MPWRSACQLPVHAAGDGDEGCQPGEPWFDLESKKGACTGSPIAHALQIMVPPKVVERILRQSAPSEQRMQPGQHAWLACSALP